MIEQTGWTLQKIREAYSEILKYYNILFSPQPNGKKEEEALPDAVDSEGDNFYKRALFRKLKKISPKIKAAADQSGNAQIWHAGEPLDDLSPSMKERIEKALKFGL